MPHNVEIKARLQDFEATRAIAKTLADHPEELIVQEDLFFNVPQGRLKLRIFSPSRGQLIYYEREANEGPRLCNYAIAPIAEVEKMQQLLTMACGVRGTVRKIRHLFLAGQTRIHLDRVAGLGDFLELEVVMREDQSNAQGEAIAQDLMAKLQIRTSDLLQNAYIDML